MLIPAADVWYSHGAVQRICEANPVVDYVLKPSWSVRLQSAANAVLPIAIGIVLLVLLVGYWRSFSSDDSAQFVSRGVHWEYASRNGAIVFDNLPQITIEKQVRERLHSQLDPLIEASEEFSRTSTHAVDGPGRRGLQEDELILQFNALGYYPLTSTSMHLRKYGKLPTFVFSPLGHPVFAKIPAPPPSTPAEQYEIPYSVPFVLIGVWPLYSMLMAFARQVSRRHGGLCVACGYDLRGGHERCPECGTETADRGYVHMLTRKLRAAFRSVRQAARFIGDTGPFVLFMLVWTFCLMLPLPFQVYEATSTLPGGEFQVRFSDFQFTHAMIEVVVGVGTLCLVCLANRKLAK